MTALTDNKPGGREVVAGTERFIGRFAVNAASVIFNGALVMVDATGALVPAADTAGCKFVGYVQEGTTGGAADGDEKVAVYCGLVKVTTATTAQDDIGDVMNVVDDDSVDDAAASTNDITCGILVERLSATEAWVHLQPTSL